MHASFTKEDIAGDFGGLGLSVCESAPYLQNVCINATGQNQVKLPAESDQISEEKQTFVSERGV